MGRLRSTSSLIVVVGLLMAMATALVSAPAATAAPRSEPAAPSGTSISGGVSLDGRPFASAQVWVMAAGRVPGEARVVARGRTDARGEFTVRGVRRLVDTEYYVVATKGRGAPSGVRLAVGLGPTWPSRVTVNELTTVATGFALAQFTRQGRIGGAQPGLGNAMAMVRNLVDIRSGAPSTLVRIAPNGTRTQTWRSLNSMGNVLSGCRRAEDCRRFLSLASPAGVERATDTLQAVANIAARPASNADRIFRLQDGRFRPALVRPPTSWLMALVFDGNGRQFRGPGNFLFDGDGNLWITNNYVPATDKRRVCGGIDVLKLEPYAPGHPVTSYTGGGISGAGYGITMDSAGRVWVSNYGFKGSRCPVDPPSNSLTALTQDGEPLSPAGGYTQGGVTDAGLVMPISWPQGMASGADGSVWTANCGADTITRYVDGDPTRSQNFGDGIDKPFGLVLDPDDNAWVTSVGGDRVFAYRPDGRQLPGSPFTDPSIVKPLGIAVDTQGNKWISNSMKINLPCGGSTGGSPSVPSLGRTDKAPTITEITASRPGPGLLGRRTHHSLGHRHGRRRQRLGRQLRRPARVALLRLRGGVPAGRSHGGSIGRERPRLRRTRAQHRCADRPGGQRVAGQQLEGRAAAGGSRWAQHGRPRGCRGAGRAARWRSTRATSLTLVPLVHSGPDHARRRGEAMHIRLSVTALAVATGLAVAVAAPAAAAPDTTTIVLRQDAPVIAPLPGAQAGETGYSFAYEAVLRATGGKRLGLMSGVVQTIDVTVEGSFEEVRHREIVFSLKGGQLVAQGVSIYPDSETEVAAKRPVVIAIVGGTGDYLGASGEVRTTRRADGSYRHVITLLR